MEIGLLFGLLFLFIFLGVPIAYSMGLAATVFTIAIGEAPLLVLIPQRLASSLDSFPLLAVPCFLLAGFLMNRGGITDRIFRFAESIVGHIPGGLGHVNVLGSMIFAGVSGSAAADASGLGAVELKAMYDAGYDRPFSCAITAASSTIGPIIPPSVPFLLYGVLAGVSVGRLFLGGIVPGFLMGLALMVYVYIVAVKRRYPRCVWRGWCEIWRNFLDSLPALLMPVMIVACIALSVVTPSEAGIIAVIYALIVGLLVYKGFRLRDLPGILVEAARDCGTILLIVGASGIFSWWLSRLQVGQLLVQLIFSVSESPTVVLGLVVVSILIIGLIMDPLPALIVFIPVLMPIVERLNLDPVHFGVMAVLGLMIGLVTPPVAMCLYIVSYIGKVPVMAVVKEMWGAILALVIVLLIVAYVPQTVTFVPNLIMGR